MSSKFLERRGLLNWECESLETLASQTRRRTVPYCSSRICCRQGLSKVRKFDVGGRPNRCPDCGYYLVYAPERGGKAKYGDADD